MVSDYENNVIGLDSARIGNRLLYRQLQSIDRLPKRDQEALFRTIDAFLSKAT